MAALTPAGEIQLAPPFVAANGAHAHARSGSSLLLGSTFGALAPHQQYLRVASIVGMPGRGRGRLTRPRPRDQKSRADPAEPLVCRDPHVGIARLLAVDHFAPLQFGVRESIAALWLCATGRAESRLAPPRWDELMV
jgi:hypothetical protein